MKLPVLALIIRHCFKIFNTPYFQTRFLTSALKGRHLSKIVILCQVERVNSNVKWQRLLWYKHLRWLRLPNHKESIFVIRRKNTPTFTVESTGARASTGSLLPASHAWHPRRASTRGKNSERPSRLACSRALGRSENHGEGGRARYINSSHVMEKVLLLYLPD